MNQPINVKTTIVAVRNSISSAMAGRAIFPLLALALVYFALRPTALAADGGLPNNNTAEGNGALQRLTTGSGSTAIGSAALTNNTTGDDNTAVGSFWTPPAASTRPPVG